VSLRLLSLYTRCGAFGRPKSSADQQKSNCKCLELGSSPRCRWAAFKQTKSSQRNVFSRFYTKSAKREQFFTDPPPDKKLTLPTILCILYAVANCMVLKSFHSLCGAAANLFALPACWHTYRTRPTVLLFEVWKNSFDIGRCSTVGCLLRPKAKKSLSIFR